MLFSVLLIFSIINVKSDTPTDNDAGVITDDLYEEKEQDDNLTLQLDDLISELHLSDFDTIVLFPRFTLTDVITKIKDFLKQHPDYEIQEEQFVQILSRGCDVELLNMILYKFIPARPWNEYVSKMIDSSQYRENYSLIEYIMKRAQIPISPVFISATKQDANLGIAALLPQNRSRIFEYFSGARLPYHLGIQIAQQKGSFLGQEIRYLPRVLTNYGLCFRTTILRNMNLFIGFSFILDMYSSERLEWNDIDDYVSKVSVEGVEDIKNPRSKKLLLKDPILSQQDVLAIDFSSNSQKANSSDKKKVEAWKERANLLGRSIFFNAFTLKMLEGFVQINFWNTWFIRLLKKQDLLSAYSQISKINILCGTRIKDQETSSNMSFLKDFGIEVGCFYFRNLPFCTDIGLSIKHYFEQDYHISSWLSKINLLLGGGIFDTINLFMIGGVFAAQSHFLMKGHKFLLDPKILVPMSLFILKEVGGETIAYFSRSLDDKLQATRITESERPSIQLSDIIGHREIKNQLAKAIDGLMNPWKYKALGARPCKGYLFVGPPGTGKTLLAKGLAGSVGIPFYSISLGKLLEGRQGSLSLKIKKLFESLKTPCIVFFDEIDAIGKVRSANLEGNNEAEQALNQLLQELDGAETKSGIFVIGATNREDCVDPALRRRFGKSIVFKRPDEEMRYAMLSEKLAQISVEQGACDVEEIVSYTAGFTAADLDQLVNEIALNAVRYGRKKANKQDIIRALQESRQGVYAKRESELPDVSLESVRGLTFQKEIVDKMIDYLNNRRIYSSFGVKPPRGFLFAGPPGTGKTLLAKAVAATSNVPFFQVSASDLLGPDGLKKLHDIFLELSQSQDAVFFVDEIDAIGGKRYGDNKVDVSILTAFLTNMDGFASQNRITFIGATNHPEQLDSALLRRFPTIVDVPLPDSKGVADILKYYLRKSRIPLKQTEDEIADIMTHKLLGFSAADIENIVNMALTECVYQACETQIMPVLTVEDLIKARENVVVTRIKLHLPVPESAMKDGTLDRVLEKETSVWEKYQKEVNNKEVENLIEEYSQQQQEAKELVDDETKE